MPENLHDYHNCQTLGNWEYDVWINEDGNLGFTIYEKGKRCFSCPGGSDDTRSIDLIIKPEDVINGCSVVSASRCMSSES